MKKITLLLIFCLSVFFLTSYVSKAQGQDLSEELVEMFSLLDKDKIGTGYLLDQSPDFVDIARFDGSALVDSNYVDIGVFEGFFRCLNAAKVNNNMALYNATNIISDLQSEGENEVKIGAALLEYNYIVANALTDNLITYSNGMVDDAYNGNVWKNPYGQRYACLITTGKPEVEGLSVYYSFDYYDNFWTSIDPSSIEIDFGDGQGYVSVASGYSGTINYSTSGTVEIKMRVVLEDDSVLLSHTSITLTPYPVQSLDVGLQPDFVITYESTYSGESVSANVSYKYSQGHNHLSRPLIYVEGFDDPSLSVLGDLKSLFNVGSFPMGNQYYERFIQSFYSSVPDSIKVKYDVVYVDWGNPRADIKGNAQLLETIINDVNTMKHQNGSFERNVIVGHSMGGLVVRYALVDMEGKTIPQLHETDHYVSYDCPHLGANVPIGAQYAVRDFVRCFYHDGYSATPFGILVQWMVNSVSTALDCSSAKQMMYRRILSSGEEDNSAHLAWQEELGQLGFPMGDKGHPIENIAISNGNVVNYNSFMQKPILHVGIDVSYAIPSLSHFLVTLGTISKIKADITINRSKSPVDTVSVVRINYSKSFSWLPDSRPFYSKSLLDAQHMDNYSGYRYDKVPSSIIDRTPNLPSYLSGLLSVTDSIRFAFVPVASALAVNDYSYDRDFYLTPPAPLVDTPFSSFRVFPFAISHVTPFADFMPWLTDQMDITISSPGAIIRPGDEISVNDFSTPSSSHSTFLGSSNISLNSNNEVSLIDTTLVELVTFSYFSTDGIASHHKHRKLLTGFPSFVLSSQEEFANNFTITANCGNDQINEFLEDAAAGGKISFVWGVKIGSGDIQWSDTSSRSFSINPQSTTYVYCKIRDDRGRESSIKGTTIIPNIGPPQSLVNYDPRIIYTFMGNSSLYYSIIDGSNLNDNYFVVWSKPLRPFSQTPDRIIINGQTIMRDTVSTETIGGTSTTIYCFKIFDSNQIQSVISNIDSYPGNTTTVSGMLYGGSTWLQDFTITITKGLPPL